MIKHFCDVCGEEMTDENTPVAGENNRRVCVEVKGKHGTMKAEVITSLDNTSNVGDFCMYCIIDAINKADDRPKSAP